MIEAVCVKSYEDTTHKLKEIEAQILRKRTELRQFETEYRKVMLPDFLIMAFIDIWQYICGYAFYVCLVGIVALSRSDE